MGDFVREGKLLPVRAEIQKYSCVKPMVTLGPAEFYQWLIKLLAAFQNLNLKARLYHCNWRAEAFKPGLSQQTQLSNQAYLFRGSSKINIHVEST